MDGRVTFHFWVYVTLTTDLVFRIFLSRAYLLYYLARNPKFGLWMDLGMTECPVLSFGHFDLT